MKRAAVLITGASTGIGLASAELLARQGFLTFAGIRDDAAARRLAALHDNIRPVRLDVTDTVTIEAAAREVAASGEPLRAVVNNAGIAVAGPLEFVAVDDLRRQFEVNVFGAIAVAQAFLPQLREHRGRLIFVGSVSGRFAVPYLAPYSASKFALRAVADAMRVELSRAAVSVSLIEPGSVKTPIWKKGRDGKDDLIRRLGPRAMRHYAREIDALMELTVDQERGAISVEHVARAIAHAVSAPRPRAYYPLGPGSRLAGIVTLLPAGARDRFFFGARRGKNT